MAPSESIAINLDVGSGQEEQSELRRSARYLFIVLIILAFFFAFNYLYFFGITSPPKDGLLTLANHNDKTQYKTWENLVASYSWLAPPTTIKSSNFQVNVSEADSTFWPKNVLMLQVTISPTRPNPYAQTPTLYLPSVLILVLDSNDFVRGKLYVQFSSTDDLVSGQSTTLYFSFGIPSDMQGNQLTVIVESWGDTAYYGGQTIAQLPRSYADSDSLYGQLPPNSQQNLPVNYQMVGYDRQQFSTVTSWPTSILQIGPVLAISGFLSATLGGLAYSRRRIAAFLKKRFPEYQAFTLFVVLTFFFLALFMILIALRVA